MQTAAFDTLATAHALKEAGFEDVQATAIVDALRQAVTEGVATKTDIADVRGDTNELRTELKSDMNELRTELKSDMNELRTELKSDMNELRMEFKADMATLRAEFKADMAALKADNGELRADLYRALWMQAAGIIGLTVALLKIL